MIDISPDKTKIDLNTYCANGWANVAIYESDLICSGFGHCQTLLIKNGIFKVVDPYKNAFDRIFDLDEKISRSSFSSVMYNSGEDRSICLPNFTIEYLEEKETSTRYEKHIKRAILVSIGMK